MNLSSHRFRRLIALLAALTTVVGVVPVASADDWARDRAATVALQELDPAIRAAIESRTAPTTGVAPVPTLAVSASPSAGFAWGAAALGLLVGVGAMCVALACVTLVRHDGRLRSA